MSKRRQFNVFAEVEKTSTGEPDVFLVFIIDVQVKNRYLKDLLLFKMKVFVMAKCYIIQQKP